MATQNLGNVRALIRSATAPTNTDLLWRNTSVSPETINIYNSVTLVWEPIAMASGGQDNTASNLGTGEGLFGQKVGVDLQFKSLIGGTNVTLSSDSTSVTINSTDTGEANTASNLGTGEGLATTKSGVNLPFKSLVGSSGITLSSDANTVTIAGAATVGARAISSTAIANNATHTVDMSASAVVQLNVAAAATAITLAVSNLQATMEMRNKVIIDNNANSSALNVTFNDQSGAITFRRALNEFPGTYPTMNVPANTIWEVEFESESATRILLDFIQTEE